MEKNRFLKDKQVKVSKKLINTTVLLLLVLILLVGSRYLAGFISSTLVLLRAYSPYFIRGILVTVVLSLIAVTAGCLLGLLIYTMRSSHSKVSSRIAKAFVEIIRGTPLLVQMFIVFIGATTLVNIRELGLSSAVFAFIAGTIAVSINSGAYVSEIIRSGIQSIPKGQMEAGRSLGLSKKQTMREIIYPQAIKNILPAIGNEFITIIKETSIVSYIGVTDIMYNVNIVKSISYKPMQSLVISAIMYFVLTFSLSRLLALFERRLKNSD